MDNKYSDRTHQRRIRKLEALTPKSAGSRIKLKKNRKFTRNCAKMCYLNGHTYHTLFFFFNKNIFYKNIEAEICEILRIF